TARMQRIAERMLLLASVEKRRELAQAQALDLAAVIERVLASRQMALDARKLRVNLVIETVPVTGDVFLLEHAVGNLLDNAIEFSPPAGELTVELRSIDRTARIAIKDNGPGIPGFAETRIFERFYSLSRPDGAGKSTGLGLSFVREVARLHGGKVSVRNADTGGVIAMLFLPLA